MSTPHSASRLGENAFFGVRFFCLRHSFVHCSVCMCANACRFSVCACCFLVDFSVHFTSLLNFSVRSFGALSRHSVSLLYRDPVAFLWRSGFAPSVLWEQKGLLAPSLSVSSRWEINFFISLFEFITFDLASIYFCLLRWGDQVFLLSVRVGRDCTHFLATLLA